MAIIKRIILNRSDAINTSSFFILIIIKFKNNRLVLTKETVANQQIQIYENLNYLFLAKSFSSSKEYFSNISLR
jgi:hypothetical protein